MKKIIVLLLVAVCCVGGLGYLALDTAFGLDAKSKNKKEKAITDVGSAGMISREMRPGGFDKIEAEGPVKIIFTQGAAGTLFLKGNSFEMEHINVVVKNSKLKITFDKEYFNSTDKMFSRHKRQEVEIRMSAPVIREVQTSCSARFIAAKLNSGDNLDLEADTSGSIEIDDVRCAVLDVEADTSGSVAVGRFDAIELKAEADTSGKVKISGSAPNAKLEADTSGSVEVAALDTGSLVTKADTSGSVNVRNLTAANVSGHADTSGSITLKGSAETVNFSADTSGSVKAGELKAETATVKSDTGGSIKYCAKSTNVKNSSMVNTYKGE